MIRIEEMMSLDHKKKALLHMELDLSHPREKDPLRGNKYLQVEVALPFPNYLCLL